MAQERNKNIIAVLECKLRYFPEQQRSTDVYVHDFGELFFVPDRIHLQEIFPTSGANVECL